MDNFEKEEIWRDIPNYEGIYQVSNLGRIRSLDRFVNNYKSRTKKGLVRGKILKPCLDSLDAHKGYYFVTFNDRKHYKVHRLVAFSFPEICGEWFEGAEVNHKNEIKTDNRAENLEWCTRAYNINFGTAIKRKTEKMIGHVVADETKHKIVETRRKNNSYKHTQITIDKIKESRKRKPVLQFTLEDVFVKEYPSLIQAHRETGFSFQNISACCKGKRKTAHGFKWKYKN